MGNIKKVQNHEYHVSEESRDKMDVEKPKQCNIKLDIEVERTQLMTKRPPRVDATQIGSKKIEFQLELRNRFKTLQELDDIDTMSKTTIYMTKQHASIVAKAINKPHKSRR